MDIAKSLLLPKPAYMSRTFFFLAKLAWNSRVTLPMIVAATFMAMDFRMQVEINVHTEGMVFQNDEQNQIDELTLSDADSWQTIDSDDELYSDLDFYGSDNDE